jgi:hypothetical protein
MEAIAGSHEDLAIGDGDEAAICDIGHELDEETRSPEVCRHSWPILCLQLTAMPCTGTSINMCARRVI